MKKILSAHYEKIILAVLLIVFAALLYYQVQVVQQVQNKEVDIRVNPAPKPSDYEPIDFAGDKKYRMENVFSERLAIDLTADTNQNVTEMMAPYALAEWGRGTSIFQSRKSHFFVADYQEISDATSDICRGAGKRRF